MRAAKGSSLVEIVLVAGVIAVAAVAAVPPVLAALDGQRAEGAARYLAAQLHRVRAQAVSRSTRVALRIESTPTGYAYTAYVDGNRDGVRSADIAQHIDRPLGAAERLPDQFTGVDFGLIPGLPPVDPGGSPPGTDPIRLGPGNMLSFSATGTSSSGSLYVRSGESQCVIRVFGDTARIRVLRFNARTQRWEQL